MAKRIHKDVEYAVNDRSGHQHTFKTPQDASAFAIAIAVSDGNPVNIDVLVWSRAGAKAYRGSGDGEEEYDEDPDASVFERIIVRAEAIGRVS